MAREMGLGVVPYAPMGGGVLTGKFSTSHLTGLDAAGAIGPGYPHAFLAGEFARTQTRGGLKIEVRR